MLWPFRASFVRPDHDEAVDFAHRLVYSACMHRVLHGATMESPMPLEWDRFTDELSAAAALYLLGVLPQR
jgi:hypothetical protein